MAEDHFHYPITNHELDPNFSFDFYQIDSLFDLIINQMADVIMVAFGLSMITYY